MARVRLNTGQFHPQFVDFANHYGFTIRTHQVRRPRTKGKVERFISYVKDNFLNGREFAVIDERWRERFGANRVDELRKCLRALIQDLNLELPDHMPILTYGLFSRLDERAPSTRSGDRQAGVNGSVQPHAPLSTLLSRPLLAFALEFEAGSDVSLAIWANTLRLIHEEGLKVAELPAASGASKELPRWR